MNIAQSVSTATSALEEAGVPQPRRQASSLLAFVLDREPAYLIAHPEYELDEEQAAAFGLVIERRAEREPFQYITGHQEFYGLDFNVEPEVLIPRPETELLVDIAIDLLRQCEKPTFLEIGVGSGCISTSILHSLTTSLGVATDVSPIAISLANRNARKHGVKDRMTIVNGNLFAGIDEKFHLIVTNPPYIPDCDIETLQPEVRDHEPRMALAGGPDGLAIVRKIIAQAPTYLRPSGSLLIEIGYGQAEAVAAEFDQHIWLQPSFRNDLQGIPRVAAAILRS